MIMTLVHTSLDVFTFLRDNQVTSTPSDVTTSSSSLTDPSAPVTIIADDIIITSSSEVSSITNVVMTSRPVTTATAADATALNVSDTASDDNVTQSMSTDQQHTTNDNDTTINTASPSVLHSDNSTDGLSNVNSDNGHNSSSMNTTEGSGDLEVSTPNNNSNITMETSHVNNTEEDYDSGEEEMFTDSLPTHQPPLATAGQQQKSSVLIRLSNRIKELEVNMSLFGDYLERVRTRYVSNQIIKYTQLYLVNCNLSTQLNFENSVLGYKIYHPHTT